MYNFLLADKVGIMDKDTVKKTHELLHQVHRYTKQYYHSVTLCNRKRTDKIFGPLCFEYTLKDLLLIGALTESPVLLTGGTDLGKTTLARLFNNSLFGKEEVGWHRLDFDLDFGKDSYTNIKSDFFQESGQTLDDLYSAHKWLMLPGFIADELNGAHPKIIRKALHIFKEKDITLPNATRVKIGTPIGMGHTYQFQIATINEGLGYDGTFSLDKALRRRTTIEIPMDIFKPSPYDRLALQQNKKRALSLENDISYLEDVLCVYRAINSQLSIGSEAEMYLSFLESFEYCANSITGNKDSLISNNGTIDHICSAPPTGELLNSEAACRYLKIFPKSLCPNVRGITPGISEDLIMVSKGFALLRAVKFVELVHAAKTNNTFFLNNAGIKSSEKFIELCKSYSKNSKDFYKGAIDQYIENLEVDYLDIINAAPFVGYSKIGITEPWVFKNFQGNKFEALKFFIDEATKKYKEGLQKIVVQAQPNNTSIRDISPEDLQDVLRYCEDSNPWMGRVIEPYFIDTPDRDEEDIVGLYD